MCDQGSGFAGEVEGCDLGAIRSRSRTAKSKGAKSKGSGLWVRSLSGCDLSGRSLAGQRDVLSPSLSLFVCVFRNPFEGKIATEIDFRLEREFSVKAEINFRWSYFPVLTKHTFLQKTISESGLKSKQTQPKTKYNTLISNYNYNLEKS